MLYISLTVFIVAGVAGAYLWWHVPRHESAIAVLTIVASSCVLVLLSLGNPRPFLYNQASQMTLIAHHLDEPRAIYIWVQGPRHPIAYELPWSQEQARQLYESKQRAKGGKVIAERNGRRYGEWTFHLPNPPSFPKKEPLQ